MNALIPSLHRPVLLAEALAGLAIRPDGHYIDATFGRGGHAAAILALLGPTGSLLALDRDPSAGEWAKEKFTGDNRFQFIQACFSRLAEVVTKRDLLGRIDGVLLDLGVSSPQLDDPARGFSFSRDGALDMRMDPTSGQSAADWVNQADEAEIARVLMEFGEERFHRRIARILVAARQQTPIVSTAQLAQIVAGAVPTREPGKHPATRVFQAIRIAVNEELDELSEALPQAVRVLGSRGRLVAISFHSLEDRMVKRFMREQARGRELPLDLPVRGVPEGISLRVIGRAVRPHEAEITTNLRARSAVLRVAEKV